MPKITQIDVSYTYPEYTKLKPIVQQGEGNIRAVVGTEVQIRATANKGIAEATLNIEGKPHPLPLSPRERGDRPMAITAGRTLTCELTVLEDSKYTINVTCVDGFKNQDPIEYTITALKDEPPKVVITKPGRDISATKVEEVDVVVEATDDFGVASMDLKYSVGINKETSAPMELSRPSGDSKKISGTHTFFLEEMNIEPGDVITYHAEALDNNTRSGPSQGISEIYFIEIRPFKERFEEMNAQSGAPDATSELLSGLIAEQKRIIRETWKLVIASFLATRPSPVTKDYEFDVKKQGDAQTKLRDKLQKVIGEINSFMRTGVIEPEALNNFENAADEMDAASNELFAIKTSDALPHQQKALEYLNKALLDIPKILLRMQQSFNPQIAENLELNMENLQNQFENRENKLDEQMHKQTKEMLEQARDMLEKQQQLTQQSRDMSKESQPSQQQMNQMSQQESQLSQQASQMAQQLSNMAQNNSFMSPQASQKMEQAAQQMQSASQNLTEGLPSNEVKGSQQSQEERQREALQMSAANGAKSEENIQKAIEELEKVSASFTAEALKDATERLQRMMAQQEKLKQETEQLEQRTQRDGMFRESEFRKAENAEDRREANRMAGQQQQMRNNLNRLQSDLENIDGNLRNSSPEASKHVERALGTIQKDKVKRDMTEAQRNLQWQNFEFAKRKQEEVLNSLSDMENDLQSARTRLATTEEERLENALEQLAKWQEKLEDIQREMEALKDQKPLTQEQQKRLQELAQQQSELRERAEQMRELADALNMNNQWRDWTQAMHNWRGAWNPRFADYDMALKNLNILRRTMEQRLDLIQEKKRLAQVRQEDVPPEYRPLVDSYYESLSE
jgi:hypothetical protein